MAFLTAAPGVPSPAALHGQLAALEADIAHARRLGEQIGQLRLLSDDEDSSSWPADIAEALRLSHELEQHTRRTYRSTERTLVPCVAAFVPRSEQEKFNGRVIRHLGVWPSRLHLVSMAEAIADDMAEQRQFRKQIPKVARMMIPHWRRSLYLPRTACLRNS